VMYTSGSTGTPKGVMVSHRGVTRLVLKTNYVTIGPQARIAPGLNVSFVWATFEIWGALLNGARMVGIGREVLLSPADLVAEIAAQGIGILWLTASLFGEVARALPHAYAGLDYMLFGGEAADPRWVGAVVAGGRPAHLVNGYGPTEATTFSICHEVVLE